jgi:hypothetical protein
MIILHVMHVSVWGRFMSNVILRFEAFSSDDVTRSADGSAARRPDERERERVTDRLAWLVFVFAQATFPTFQIWVTR